MVTAFWLSSAVEKVWLFLVGMVVLRSIRRVNTPPSVSMPSESGVTSSSSTSFTSPLSTPAWIAAPSATTSSGLTPRCGSRPKKVFTVSITFGIRVMPPTSTTSAMSEARQAGIFQRLLAGADGALDQVLDQRLQLGPGELDVEVLRPRLVGRDERQVDLGLRGRAQLDLRLLSRFLEPLQRQLVAAQVDALLLAELVSQIVDDAAVEILAAEMGVAVGGLDLEHAVADLQHGDIEGAAAEVIDGDNAALLLFEAVGKRGRRRLIDDAQHFEAGDAPGVLGRLALGIVEIGRHGNDRVGHRLAEKRLGRLLHLLEDEGADLARRIGLVARLHPGVAIVGLDQRERAASSSLPGSPGPGPCGRSGA